MRVFPPLLTTSAIKPGDVPFLRMKDTDKRLEAHLKAIMYWKNNFPNFIKKIDVNSSLDK